MKKTVCTLLILTTLLLTLAGCSGGNSDADTTGTTTAAVTKKPDPLDALADTDPVFAEKYVYDDYTPYIETGDLDNIEVSHAAVDKLVETFMAEVLKNFQGVDFVDAPEGATVADKDRATIHYTGYSANPDFTIDEDTLANMTNKDSEEGFGLVIGSGSFIRAYESEEHPENNNPSFEEQLIGAKVGETRTITVTFPDVYSSAPELQGRPIKFDVTIEKIENPDPDEPTELTDDLVKEYTGGEYTTIAALTEFKQSDCKAQLAYENVYGKINVVNYPESEYDELFQSYMDYYTYEDISDEDLAALRESGEKAVKEVIDEELILNFLYHHFDITLTKGEYLEKLQTTYDENAMMFIYYYGVYSLEDMEDYFTRDYWISFFKSEKLSDLLSEKAVWID